MSEAAFSPALFTFLRELRENNDREWFEANRARYDELFLEPALAFIEAFAPHLRKVSPEFVASPRRVGGSLFRIHRDVRFAKDKSPYKTHVGIQFRHRLAADVHSPGYYLHIEPRNCFAAVGIWHPDSTALSKIRAAIVESPTKWKSATQRDRFAGVYELGGDSLKRPPSGYDGEHPLIEDLKRKDFIGVSKLTNRAVTSDRFLLDYAETCRASDPFIRFLCGALSIPF